MAEEYKPDEEYKFDEPTSGDVFATKEADERLSEVGGVNFRKLVLLGLVFLVLILGVYKILGTFTGKKVVKIKRPEPPVTVVASSPRVAAKAAPLKRKIRGTTTATIQHFSPHLRTKRATLFISLLTSPLLYKKS